MKKNALVKIKQFNHLRYEGNRNPAKRVNKLCGKLRNLNANPPLLEGEGARESLEPAATSDTSPREDEENTVESPSDEIEKSSGSHNASEEEDCATNFPSQCLKNGNISSNVSNGVVWRTSSNVITTDLSHKQRHTGSSEEDEESPPINKRRLENSGFSANHVNSRKGRRSNFPSF